jgi:O-antigen ligase/polysaccharide polymerase Wzy-like membrane protein
MATHLWTGKRLMNEVVTTGAPPGSRGSSVPGGHPVDLVVMVLLVLGFFLGPLKLLGTGWLSYLSADGLALVIVIGVFGERIAEGKPLFAASPLSVPLLLLGAFCVLELANPEAPFLRSVMGLRSWLLYLSFYFVGLYTFRSAKQLERLYSLLIILGVITALYGIYQWRAGPQAFATWSDYYAEYARLAWYTHSVRVFRAFSTFVAAGTFGGNMSQVMLLAFSVAICSRVRPVWRVLAVAGFAVMGAGIAASGSRGPVAYLLLCAAAATFMIAGLRSKLAVLARVLPMTIAAVLLIVVFVGPVIGQRFSTIFDPEQFFWKWFGPFTRGLSIAAAHPFGMGLGYTAGVPKFIANPALRDLPGTNVDSGYGSAAAELGFIGLVLFGYFAVTVGVRGFKAWISLPPGRTKDLLLGPALYAATYPIVLVIFQPQAALPSSIYFWLPVGMLFRASTVQEGVHADRLFRAEMHQRK